LLIIPYGIYSSAKHFIPFLGVGVLGTDCLRIALVCLLFLAGAIFGIWSIVVLAIVGKGGPVQVGYIEISPKTQNLVVSGPYRYTRNPMLFGACMMYFAYAVYLNSITAVITVAVFMTAMLFFVKFSEEKRLLKDFGEQYKEYRKRVSLFIPWFPKK
jgi:steroid 5-alpha reductase family enzyme